MSELLIAGGRVLTPSLEVRSADVLVDQRAGTIEEIGTGLGTRDTELDASGALVMPGLVNAHTHVAMTLMRGYADDKPVDQWLAEDIWPIEAEFTPEDIRAGAALGILELIKTGTTAFADMYFEVDRIAEVVREAGVRARLGYGMVTEGADRGEALEELRHGLEVAVELDDGAEGRVTSAYMPHSLTTADIDLLPEFLPEARDRGIPVHYHANESPAFVDPIVEEREARPLEVADEKGLLAPGDFLAHGIHLDEAEIELLAERSVGIAHCPTSNMKLASGMAPISALRDAGVTVGIGTDGAASNNDLDMFGELQDAALLGKLAADDPRAVPAPAAVEMATKGGADLLGLRTGRVAEGWPADLAVLDLSSPRLQPEHDLVSHIAYAVQGTDVRHTICDGQVLMRDREVLTLDEAAVIEQAGEAATALLERVDA